MERPTANFTTPSSVPRPRLYYGWILVGASFLFSAFTMGIQGSFGNFIKPMSAEFGWDRATVTLPIAIATLMSGIFQPIVGRLVDHYGPRQVITIGVALLAISVIAVSWTNSIWYLVVIYGVLFALATSTAGGIPNSTLTSRWFIRLRGRAMSIVAAGGSVGQVLIIPGSMMLMSATNWRTTHLILGCCVLVLAMPIAVFMLRNDPQDMGLLPDGDTLVEVDTDKTSKSPAPKPSRAPLEPEKWQGAFASSQFWFLIGSFFVCGYSVAMLQTHFVPYVTDLGISPDVAATALGLRSGFNILGLILGGVLADRVGRKIPLAIIYFVRAIAIVFLLTVDTPVMLYLFAIVAGLAWFASVPLTITLTVDIYGLRHMGTLVGFVFLGHQLGGALGTYLAGWLFDVTGSYTGVFFTCAVLLFVASGMSWVIQERRYSIRYQRTVTG